MIDFPPMARYPSDMTRPTSRVKRQIVPRAAGKFSRPPLARMIKLHHQLQARRFPNCRKLADDLEVSSKTIQRDIVFMRDQLNLPIEYDQLKFGFFYSEPVVAFPSVKVSEGEMVALFVAQKAIAQYRGTSFEKPLKAAFEKISEGLKEQIAFNWADVDAAISFKGIGATMADLELFEIVSKAVLGSRELEFEYKKLGGPRHELRKVQPYHLGCIENQWYLFAHDLARRQLRTFTLPRMRKAKTSGVRFTRPADFSINRLLSGSFGVFTGQGRYRVRVRFEEPVARLISEREWHPSQKIKSFPDGSIEIAMQLDSLREIERWVLSWGARARALEPPELVERMRAATLAASRFY